MNLNLYRSSSPAAPASEEYQVRRIYQQMLEEWNRRDASRISKLYTQDGNIVGFDGSPINGRTEIEKMMSQIFADHQTAAYIGVIREVRFLTAEVAILRAVAGMVPPGKSDLNPAVNAIQSLIAVKQDGEWYIALFQNTPAQFHGRPDLAEQLTDELRQLLR